MSNFNASKLKTFAKFVEAIRVASGRGVTVKWNDEINGYMFDVVLRQYSGDFKYLIAVDFSESESTLSAEQVQVFGAKTREAGIHFPILVSASELDDACQKPATEFALRITTLNRINTASIETLSQLLYVLPNFYQFRFKPLYGNYEIAIPEEPEQISFTYPNIKITGPDIDITLSDLIKGYEYPVAKSAKAMEEKFVVVFPQGTSLIHPSTGRATPIKSFSFLYRLVSEAELESNGWIGQQPPLLLVSLAEELAKRNSTADPSRIGKGFDTKLEEGRYYYNPQLKQSYFCEKIKGQIAFFVLVESYALGKFVRMKFTQELRYKSQYVEVIEESEVVRLKQLHEDFLISRLNLEDRFKVFLKQLERVESIDDLPLLPNQKKAEKADYFLNQRQLICELKSLKSDVKGKIDKVLEPYRKTPEWPLFYGELSLQHILRNMPNKDQINAKVIAAVTEGIESNVRKANRQIRTTKDTFGLPNAGGLLIILNDTIYDLAPDMIVYRIRQAINKKTLEGDLCHPYISAVLLISQAHYVQAQDNLKLLPLLTITTSNSSSSEVVDYINKILTPQWSAFERLLLIESDVEEFLSQKFRKFDPEQDAKDFLGL